MFNVKKKQKELLRSKINTVIGEGTEIEGTVNFSGGLHVIGKICGSATSEKEDSLLIVSESAVVTGDVVAKHLIVNGQIDGTIYVDGKVELFDKARINGNIHYQDLEILQGAKVNGEMIRTTDD